MARFFFDVDDGTTLLRDEEGTELANEHAARDEATRAMGKMARDYLPKGAPQQTIIMCVRDEEGQPILQLALCFAVQLLA